MIKVYRYVSKTIISIFRTNENYIVLKLIFLINIVILVILECTPLLKT